MHLDIPLQLGIRFYVRMDLGKNMINDKDHCLEGYQYEEQEPLSLLSAEQIDALLEYLATVLASH